MLLNAHAGAKYGIPFPVFLRAPFGVRGANLAALLRAVVACGWFGIQSWIGGSAIDAMLIVIWPGAMGNARNFVGVLSRLLAAQYGGGLARRGVDSPPAGLRRAVHVCHGGGAAGLGAHEGRQLRRHAVDAEPVPHAGRVSGRILSVADGDGGLLGHAGLEHSRLHALFQIAKRAVVGAGVRLAGRDGALHVSRHRGHFGVGGAVRQADLGSGAVDRHVSSAAGGIPGA